MSSYKVGDAVPVCYRFDGNTVRRYENAVVNFVPHNSEWVWVKSGKSRFTFGGAKADAFMSFREAQLDAMHKLNRRIRTHQDRANDCRAKLNAVMAQQEGT